MGVPMAILLPDGRKTPDQLVCGDGEITEFSHAGFTLRLLIGFDQIEQDVALFGCIEHLRAAEQRGISALLTPFFFLFPHFLGILFIGVFLRSFASLFLIFTQRVPGRNHSVPLFDIGIDDALHPLDECVVPMPDAAYRFGN